MSNTPVLGLPEIAEGVASQTVLHNQALRLIEARIVRVLSRTTTAPPGSPAEGDSYIVPAGATGAWSGLADQVASFVGGGWVYYTPGEGVRLWVNDADETIVFDGAAWVLSEGGGGVGDVVGPASATDGHFASFDGATGKLLKDTLALDTDTTLAADSDARVASQKAVKAYVTASAGGAGNAITGTTGAAGGHATATGGTSTTSANAGGEARMIGGTPGATGVGGIARITGGVGGTTSGAGGAVIITGGANSTSAGTAGAVSVTGGAASGTNGVGGALNLAGGQGTNGGGGNVTITAGTTNFASSIVGGVFEARGGQGGSSFGAGGSATLRGGTAGSGGTGGAAIVLGGTGAGSGGDGGATSVTGGTGAGTGAGGAVTIMGGTPGATGNAGAVTVQGGAPVAGNGGTATLRGTSGVGTNKSGGNVLIQPGLATGTGNPGNIQLDGGRGAALATTAKGGFVTIPTCAGTPTGVPVNVPTGSVPMVFDTTGVQLWTHTGGAWQSGPPPGSVNAIINGDMMIWQRGTSFSPTGAHTADRWQYITAGFARHTIARQTGVPSVAQAGRLFNYAAILTCSTAAPTLAAGDATFLQQSIEGYNWVSCAQRACTLSFWVGANKTGVYCVSLANSSGDRSFVAEYSINVANAWEFKVIAIPPSPSAGTWNYTNGIGASVRWALSSGSTFIGTAGAWQTGQFLATANQVNATDSTSNSFALTGVDLRPGTFTAPQFVSRSFGEELALCQRYYETTFRYDTAPAAGSGFYSGDGVLGKGFSTGTAEPFYTWRFTVPKRAAPTVTLYNLRAGGAAGQWSDNGGALDSANAAVNPATTGGVAITNAGALLAAANHWAIAATAEAEL